MKSKNKVSLRQAVSIDTRSFRKFSHERRLQFTDEKDAPGLEYARRVYNIVLDWYKNADAKAQIILTIDGVFLAFITSSVFMKHDELKDILDKFHTDTWLLLVLMSIAIAGSILSAIKCLWSRIYTQKRFDDLFKNVDRNKAETYCPEVMLFFQFISRLQPEMIAERLNTLDEKFEIETLAHGLTALSENVLQKHRWANFGFALAGFSLILFLAVAGSYIIRLIA